MRNWHFWTGLVVGGLLLGAAAATGALRLAGIDATSPPAALQGTEVLAAGLVPGAERASTATLGGTATVSAAAAGASRASAPAPVPVTPKPLFDEYQVVSFYGHPMSDLMGALGEGSEEQMIARLQRQAKAYQAVNSQETLVSALHLIAQRLSGQAVAYRLPSSNRKVIPALHLIYEVAQATTNDDGLYLYRTEDETVRHYIRLTQDQGMLLFLDLQIGRSSLAAELPYVLPYLKYPHVHLAIDPEFVTPPGSRPGLDIGTLDSLEINAALDRIEQFVEQERLPNKIVIVHQFQDSMLLHKNQLNSSEPRVDLVLNMDGFGDQSGKLGKYDALIKQFGAKYAGIKLFYKHDVKLLSEQQVEDLEPRPNVIMYQ